MIRKTQLHTHTHLGTLSPSMYRDIGTTVLASNDLYGPAGIAKNKVTRAVQRSKACRLFSRITCAEERTEHHTTVHSRTYTRTQVLRSGKVREHTRNSRSEHVNRCRRFIIHRQLRDVLGDSTERLPNRRIAQRVPLASTPLHVHITVGKHVHNGGLRSHNEIDNTTGTTDA